MKKTLFMCALGLTVATSMVAGTMAIYTHTDSLLGENGTADAVAKKFYINTEATETSIINMKFAPGEQAEWDFTVTNEMKDNESYYSEVNTDMIVTLTAAEISNWSEFNIQLIDADTGEELATGKQSGNAVTLTMPDEFKANQHKTKNYKIRFKWIDEATDAVNKAQTALVYGVTDESQLPSAKSFNVTVTGQQSINNKAWTSDNANENWKGYPKN